MTASPRCLRKKTDKLESTRDIHLSAADETLTDDRPETAEDRKNALLSFMVNSLAFAAFLTALSMLLPDPILP